MSEKNRVSWKMIKDKDLLQTLIHGFRIETSFLMHLDLQLEFVGNVCILSNLCILCY